MSVSTPDHWIRELGSTGLHLSAVTIGGSPLGNVPTKFPEVSEAAAIDLVQTILASPIRAIDTSNGYSGGDSERRIGAGIAAFGGLPDDFLIITKVDAKDGDYSGERVRRSVEESRERLGLDFLPLVFLHDPEYHDYDNLTRPGGAVDTLVAMKESGEIGHIGVAGGRTPVVERYVGLGVFEVVLTHNRWTLVDRDAADLIADSSRRGMGIMNAAVNGGGILADPRSGRDRYGYRPATPGMLAAISAVADLCDRWDVPPATAALQWSLRDDRIASTVVGITNPARLTGIVEAARTVLPAEFWDEIETICPPRRDWLDGGVVPQ